MLGLLGSWAAGNDGMVAARFGRFWTLVLPSSTLFLRFSVSFVPGEEVCNL